MKIKTLVMFTAFVFWFSGHGSYNNLILYDSPLSDIGLREMLDLNVSAKAIFVDMCYAESLFSEEGDLKNLGNSIVLASSGKNGLAYEDSGFQNGVFSYFLFESFYDDETDLNQDRTTSLEEVFQKANKSTIEYTTENADIPQKPQIFDNYTEELSLEIAESVHPNFVLENHPGAGRSLMERCVAIAQNYGLENAYWAGRTDLPGVVMHIDNEIEMKYGSESTKLSGSYAYHAGCKTHPRACSACTSNQACRIKKYVPKGVT